MKTILITGTSRGIGRNVAEYFLKSDHKVFGCSRGEATFSHEDYTHHSIDISDENQVRKWVREVRMKSGKIDVLLCNAGLVESALQMTVTSSKVVEAYLNTNIAGTYYVCREVAKTMIMQKSGSVIAVSSIMTALHEPGTSMYSSCKSAVEEIIKVMALELVSFNINCNAIGLSYVETDASKAFGAEWEKGMLDKQTIKRALSIDEICNTISFFSSEQSRCITGQVLYMGLVN